MSKVGKFFTPGIHCETATRSQSRNIFIILNGPYHFELLVHSPGIVSIFNYSVPVHLLITYNLWRWYHFNLSHFSYVCGVCEIALLIFTRIIIIRVTMIMSGQRLHHICTPYSQEELMHGVTIEIRMIWGAHLLILLNNYSLVDC